MASGCTVYIVHAHSAQGGGRRDGGDPHQCLEADIRPAASSGCSSLSPRLMNSWCVSLGILKLNDSPGRIWQLLALEHEWLVIGAGLCLMSMSFKADRESNVTIEKTRRCFVWQNQIWQLDSTPHPGLMLLETYSALPTDQLTMPDFLTIKRKVTGESSYSMFNLSKTTKLSNGIHEVTVGINGLNPDQDWETVMINALGESCSERNV